MKKSAILVLCMVVFANLYAQHCGTWRWAAKTLADSDGQQILSKTPVTKTIRQLAEETAPQHLSTGHNFTGRLTGENDLVEINANIIMYKREPDHDYHLVLQDPNSTETIVAEIPDPDCDNLKDFPALQKRYRAIRDWIDSKVHHVTTSPKEADPAISVKIQGVAFWDAPHGASGASDQGREIHPITDIITNTGSVVSNYAPPGFILSPVPNETENSPQNSKPMTPLDYLIIILLGGVLGMAGQGIRVIVGMKKAIDALATNAAGAQPIDYKRTAFSLFIAFAVGGVAGVLAAVGSADAAIDKSTIIAFIAAGYAGTDFIEEFIKRNPVNTGNTNSN